MTLGVADGHSPQWLERGARVSQAVQQAHVTPQEEPGEAGSVPGMLLFRYISLL